MFLAGTEVDLRVFKNMDINLLKKSIAYISLLYLFSFLSSYYLNLSNIFVITMPLISVGLIISLFNEYGKDKKWLMLAMTVGVLGEIISITLITFSSAILTFGIGYEFYKTIAILFGFLLCIIVLFKIIEVLFWWYPGIKIYLMPFKDNDEKDIRISISIFFILIAISLYLHLEIAFGAFIAGIFISTFFKHKEELTHKLSSFGFGFLVPLFFIYVGTTLDLNSLGDTELLKKALLITFLMMGMRVVSSNIIFFELTYTKRILLGLSHSMPLTLLIAIATIAYNLQTINKEIYYAFILASIFEVIFSMIFIKIMVSNRQ
jgi:Kef-type K+ transport system membrane component KefB